MISESRTPYLVKLSCKSMGKIKIFFTCKKENVLVTYLTKRFTKGCNTAMKN